MTDKPTSLQSPANGEVSQETLEKLASRDEDIRNSGKLDIFEQHLRQIPADYVFKMRDRQFVADVMHAAFELIGGVPRFAQWAHQNDTEYYKLYARMMPEAEKAQQGPAVLQFINAVPDSPLSSGTVDLDDEESEDSEE